MSWRSARGQRACWLVRSLPDHTVELPCVEVSGARSAICVDGWARPARRSRTRDRHAVYALALAEHVAPRCASPHLHARDWRGWRRETRETCVARARGWCLESGAGADSEHGASRLAVHCHWAWYVRGDSQRVDSGWGVPSRLGKPASTETPESRALRALGLARAGAFAYFQGDVRSAGDLLDRSLATAQSLGDVHTAAEALHWKMLVLEATEGLGSGVALLEQSLHMYRGLDDAWSTSWSLGNLARVTVEQGDQARAARLASEALALAETAAIAGWLACGYTPRVLARTGCSATPRGRPRPWQHDCQSQTCSRTRIARRRSHQGPTSPCLQTWRSHSPCGATSAIARASSSRWKTSPGWPAFATRRDSPRLVGAADHLRRAVGLTVDALSMRDREALVARLRVRLGDTYEAEYGVGAALSADQAIAEALELAAPGALETGHPTSGRTRQERARRFHRASGRWRRSPHTA